MKFQDALLNWYGSHYRKLPWRATTDPYKIWLSEVMLQQTQVDTVISYYNRFIEALPSLEALAEAEEDLVLKLWEGLGYYSRARRMIQCAKVLVEKYDGQFPRNYEEMLQLPGIGPYTAGAVLSIAFNIKVPAVDGNVMRVISRNYNISVDISDPKSRKVFETQVTRLLPENRSHFNQALMELGATICTPKKASCDLCPVAFQCEALKQNLVYQLPVKSKKNTKITKQVAIAYVKFKDKVMITKRPNQGLLGGLWGFPILESKNEVITSDHLIWELKNNWGLNVELVKKANAGRHVFTHLIWEMQVYEFETQEEIILDYPQVVWVHEENLSAYPFPTAFKKLIG